MITAWCIEHSHEVEAEDSMVGICHSYSVTTETGLELDWCFFDGGYATCPPPEFRDDWDEDLEPSEEELELMEVE